MSEMKPCPFCGAVMQEHVGGQGGIVAGRHWWTHPLSDCVGEDLVFYDDQIDAWNTRVPLSETNGKE